MDEDNKNKRNQEGNYQNVSLADGRFLSHPTPGEEIVISGISGSFPESRNIEEYMNNLFNKVRMVTPSHRWDIMPPEMPIGTGNMPEIDNYDTGFFGVHELQAQSMDAMNRMLQEKTIEALFDAGINPSDLENTNAGVFMGVCFSESEKCWFFDNPNCLAFTGVSRSMMAHRVSYFLKLKGPSFTTDCACSSSMFSLEHAFRALRTGQIETAIVGGVNICTHPYVTLQFSRLGVLSMDSQCKVFDKKGNGYVRSEAVGIMILQKKRDAKRIYAEMIHAKTNSDGFKETGITFPSRDAQRLLLTDFYEECQLDPADLSFLETHGTGTFAGDSEECGAIDDVFTKGRKTPLLIGSVKSNIGHSEPASGICSLIKAIIGFETGYIPPNINFSEAKDEITGIKQGRLKVVTEKTPLPGKPAIVGVSSFGFGGGNAHVLLKQHTKDKINYGIPDDNLPRLVCLSGRTREAVMALMNNLKNNKPDSEYIRLLHDIFGKNIQNHIFRGYIIISKSGENCRFLDYCSKKNPFYLCFGEMQNWFNIGNQLMALPPFSNCLHRIHKLLLKRNIDIISILLNRSLEDSVKYNVLGSIAVQIGLIDTLKSVKVKPMDHFGYSYGELLSSYFDGVLTLEETINCAIAINKASNQINSIYLNGINALQKTQEINNDNYNYSNNFERLKTALKSVDLAAIRKQLMHELTQILLNGTNNNCSKVRQASPQYYYNALINNTHTGVGEFKPGTLVLNVGLVPLKEKHEDVKIISLFPEENKNHLVDLLRVIGNLYVSGYEPALAELYPAVEYPVSRGTRMISPHIQWNHRRKWFIPKFESERLQQAQRGSRFVKVNLSTKEWTYLDGHVVGGRNLFPATGYLCLVWDTLAVLKDMRMEDMNVEFEDCRFLTASTIPAKGTMNLNVTLHPTGKFEIVQLDSAVVTGKIRMLDEHTNLLTSSNLDGKNMERREILHMKNKDIYKELRLRGYNYRGEFKSIQSCNVDGTTAYIKWNQNWLTFMDNMLQLKILQADSRSLYVPTYIKKLTVLSQKHLNWVKGFTEPDKPVNLPVYCDPVTNQIKSGYIQIQGLLASSVARRKDLGIPVLEKHVFVPNFTTLSLEESVRVNLQILLENALVYKVKSVELIDKFTPENSTPLSPIVQSVLEDQPLIKPFLKIYSNDPLEVTVPVEISKKLDVETDNILVIGSGLLERKQVFEEALSSLKENGFIISRESLDFTSLDRTAFPVSLLTLHRTPSETLVLLRKSKPTSKPATIKVTSQNFSWIEKVKAMRKNKSNDSIILYADNEPLSGILGLVNCLRREPETSHLRCAFIMDQSQTFDPEDPLVKDHINKNMAVNVYKNGSWGTYRHMLINANISKEREHCFLNSDIKGDLSNLKWVEGRLTTQTSVAPETELIYVNYCPLNFRDVMVASGKINIETVAHNRLDYDTVQGIEFAGRTKHGRRVMGIASQAISTLIQANNNWTFDVPASMSLAEAATIPAVYATVIYGMLLRCDMKRGEAVLIHSGTGGVGQAAIRTALHYGCTVFATVGTSEKKKRLKQLFPELKESHIGNSRDLSFEQMVKKNTNGRGVDIVLNSLSEDKLLASVRCLAQKGRLVEIGKFDLANNKELSLLLLDKQVSYHGIMLDEMFFESPHVTKHMIQRLKIGLQDGWVQPLSATIFKKSETEQAFRYMTTGKHVGKVLIEVRPEIEEFDSSPKMFSCSAKFRCKSSKSYVIVGGLGGFGLELADWLVLRGARKLILTSRSGISTGYQRLRIKTWMSYGTVVHISTANIGNKQGCEKLLDEAEKLGSVDVIFNLAVVLADGVFENQTEESFNTSFEPKALATNFLDEVSRVRCPSLRNFVVFSSVSCGRGNAGQSNYGMANSVMERICEKRKNEGYPALAIQWGAIGEVGLVADMQEEQVEFEIGGTLQQKITNCMNVLDVFLSQDESVIVSSMVVAEKKGGADDADNIMDAVINILGIRDLKSISLHSTLAELGMDSMTAVEIKQTLEREFEVFLTAKDIRTMTLSRLKEIQAAKDGDTSVDARNSGGFDLGLLFNQLSLENNNIGSFKKLISQANKVQNPPQVFFFPGVEGQSVAFEPLAAQLEANVYSLEYALECQAKTLYEMKDVLLQIIFEEVSKTKTFKFIAHSYGGLLAMEIAYALENKGYKGSIALIDSAPVLMKAVHKSLSQSADWESTLICIMLKAYKLGDEELLKAKKLLDNCPSWDSRVNVGSELIKHKTTLEEDHQRALANGIYQKVKFLETYEPSYKKLKTPVLLLKAKDMESMGLSDDYELSPVLETPVTVKVLDGTHITIFDNELCSIVLNSWLKED